MVCGIINSTIRSYKISEIFITVPSVLQQEYQRKYY